VVLGWCGGNVAEEVLGWWERKERGSRESDFRIA
jgi:hypothetical protein